MVRDGSWRHGTVCGDPMRVRADRRQALFGGFCLCCLPTLGRSADTARIEEVGRGVFIRRGIDAEATPDNLDAIANIGFIIGRDSVLVTETGGSLADGTWLRGEIRKRTDKPISHVVLTHVHPDHVFGAGAFAEDKPIYVGHHLLRSALDARGDFYRKRLEDLLGADKAGTVVYPSLEVKDEAEIDLGGRKVTFRAHGAAHTNCDLSMIDRGSGLLFPADLLFVGRIPSLDGSLLGWFEESAVLTSLGASRAVPGHGPTSVDLAPALNDLTRYLGVLRDETRQAVKADVPIEKAVRTVAQSERDRWHLFDTYNARNVTQAYQQLEWE